MQLFDKISGIWRDWNISPAGAAYTHETAAMGFDPSTGRTPIEESNNYEQALLKTSAVSKIIKSAPGFLQSVQITAYGTVPATTQVVIYDNAAASGTAYISVLKVNATGATESHIENVLFNTGMSVGLATVDANGTLTAVTTITGGTYSVNVGFAYR